MVRRSKFRKVTIMLRSIITDDVTTASRKLGIGRVALSNVLNANAEVSVQLACAIEDVYRYSAEAILIEQTKQNLLEYRNSVGSRIFPTIKLNGDEE